MNLVGIERFDISLEALTKLLWISGCSRMYTKSMYKYVSLHLVSFGRSFIFWLWIIFLHWSNDLCGVDSYNTNKNISDNNTNTNKIMNTTRQRNDMFQRILQYWCIPKVIGAQAYPNVHACIRVCVFASNLVRVLIIVWIWVRSLLSSIGS